MLDVVGTGRRRGTQRLRGRWPGVAASFLLAVVTGLLAPGCNDDDRIDCGVERFEGGDVAAACAARWSNCDDGRLYGIYCERSGPGYACTCEIDLEVQEQFRRDLCPDSVRVAERRCGWDIWVDDDFDL